jgi:hypothetical protein
MTLHLTQISSSWALQVSDRLVSGGVQDPLANKNIIYFARRSVVSIGYTGLAYGLSSNNPDMPTDEWIVEILLGKPIARGWDGVRPAFSNSGDEVMNKKHLGLDIGQSIELLRSSLQDSFDKLSINHRKHPFEIIISGWQKTRRRGLHPILVQIKKDSGIKPFLIERPERDWFLGRTCLLDATPEGYILDEERQIFNEMQSFTTPDDCEKSLVQAIRSVSSRNLRSVGSHCMSICLPPPGIAPIRVRFIPASPHTITLNNTVGEVVVAYSPWIVSSHTLYSPSSIVGNINLRVGKAQIVLEGSKSNKGLLYMASSQRRPNGP